MSSETDVLVQLVASVLSQIHGLQKDGQDLVDTLHLEALAGSRTAKDTLANPWNSSVPPSRRLPDIETQLDQVRDILENVGPTFLAAAIQRERLEKQREYQLDRERAARRNAAKDDPSPAEAGYKRLFDMLRDQASVSDRDAGRVSKKAVLQFGRIIKREGQDRWCDTLISVRELSRAGLMQHVSVPVGWSVTTGEIWYTERAGHYWHQDPVEGTFRLEAAPDPFFDASRCQTVLPTAVAMDPPGLPRAWTPDSNVEMHPVLWDGMPDEHYYRSFVREIAEEENVALYRPCALPEDEEPTPPFATVDAMIRFDEDFRAAYQRADRRFRMLDGYRVGLDDMIVDELAASGRKRDGALLEWTYPVDGDVIFDDALWDAWRPWGTLLAALKDYLQYPDAGGRDCLVSGWAYFLKGRLARTEAELPVFVRRALFDWLLLPVPSVLAPAVRILVPRDRLTKHFSAGEGKGEDT
jgi:hypothetical protein